MRDILLLIVLGGALPFALARPLIAAAIYIFLSVGSIHKLAYGFSSVFPWAALYAGVLLVSVVLNSTASFSKGLKLYSSFVPLLLAVTISTLLHSEQSWTLDRYVYFLKIQFAIILIMATVRYRNDIIFILAALAASISFHAVKGSLVVLTQFTSKGISGPPESMIADNNHYATALVFCIPIVLYFAINALKNYQRIFAWCVLLACVLVAMGTWSRGGLLALGCIGFVGILMLKEHRFKLLLVILPVCALIWVLLPEGFHDRTSSISDYENDLSVQGRFDAWRVAVSIALSEPFGAGFDLYHSQTLWALHGPENSVPKAAHSIYFQLLGDHGFPGLLAFLWLLISALRAIGLPAMNNAGGLREGFSLPKAMLLALVGVLSGGAFLSLAYWEGLYVLLACMLMFANADQRVQEASSIELGGSNTAYLHAEQRVP